MPLIAHLENGILLFQTLCLAEAYFVVVAELPQAPEDDPQKR